MSEIETDSTTDHKPFPLIEVPTVFELGEIVDTPNGRGRITSIEGKIRVGNPTCECSLFYRVQDRLWQERDLQP